MMDKMMGIMMRRMSKEKKEQMMSKMMDKMSKEEKEEMMAEMMPKMMKGMNMMEMMPKMMMSMMGVGESKDGMMEMMSKMKKGGKEMEMPMMMEMMPRCINIMLPKMPKEKRIDYVLKMVTTLMEQGSVGMSVEEKKDFVVKVIEKVKV